MVGHSVSRPLRNDHDFLIQFNDLCTVFSRSKTWMSLFPNSLNLYNFWRVDAWKKSHCLWKVRRLSSGNAGGIKTNNKPAVCDHYRGSDIFCFFFSCYVCIMRGVKKNAARLAEQKKYASHLWFSPGEIATYDVRESLSFHVLFVFFRSLSPKNSTDPY